jgi:hypothetical protein
VNSRRVRSGLAVGLLTILFALVAWAVGQGAGAADPILAAPVMETLTTRTVYRDVGARLEPPQAGRSALVRVSASEALARFRSSGMFPGIEQQARGRTRMALVSFSDDVRGRWDAKGPSHLEIQNVLAWVIVFPDVPVNVFRPAPRPGQAGAPVRAFSADMRVVVDAITGTVIEAFQTGNPPATG